MFSFSLTSLTISPEYNDFDMLKLSATCQSQRGKGRNGCLQVVPVVVHTALMSILTRLRTGLVAPRTPGHTQALLSWAFLRCRVERRAL